tara:strand:+ start:14625 stop:15065 length:441 start_codon:yes stop_codon:yes gene_type:complete
MRNRLKTILSLVHEGENLWDIGCDHGLVGLDYMNQHPDASVYFVDRIKHVIEKIKGQVARDGRCYFYHMDACLGLPKPLSGNVVIAGMGAERILNIISAQKIEKNTRLILNPFKDPELIEQLPYNLVQQCTLQEGRRERSIYVFTT